MKTYKAICKQLLGSRYEQITKSLYVCVVFYVALHVAEIRVFIAPFMLYFMATAFTGGVMWQALSSSKNEGDMPGLFMLPFEPKCLSYAYTLAFSVYTIITKTLFVLVVFFAIGNFDILQITISLLCAWNACFTVAAFYIFSKQKRIWIAVVWTVLMVIVILIARQSVFVLLMSLTSFGIAVWYLSSVDTYLFYGSAAKKSKTQSFHYNGGIFIYLWRYLLENKNYLVNTLGLWGIAFFLPFLLGQFEGGVSMSFGFALICLNTPICVLLSCDPDLEQAVRCLPRQTVKFCSRYCLVIFMVQMSSCIVYLLSWQVQYGSVSWGDTVMAILFALQSAILSVGLEWFYPIRKWKVESDLWHHPRKYIIPLWLMLFATFIGMLR